MLVQRIAIYAQLFHSSLLHCAHFLTLFFLHMVVPQQMQRRMRRKKYRFARDAVAILFGLLPHALQGKKNVAQIGFAKFRIINGVQPLGAIARGFSLGVRYGGIAQNVRRPIDAARIAVEFAHFLIRHYAKHRRARAHAFQTATCFQRAAKPRIKLCHLSPRCDVLRDPTAALQSWGILCAHGIRPPARFRMPRGFCPNQQRSVHIRPTARLPSCPE